MKYTIFIILLLLTSGVSIAQDIASDAQKIASDFPELKGPYLGQSPPGMDPQIFISGELKPHMVSKWHGTPSFSSDGRKMCWVNMGDEFEIYFSEIRDEKWCKPYRPSFVGKMDENNPLYSFDGNKLYFLSFRDGGYIFEVNKLNNNKWPAPKSLKIDYPSNRGKGWGFSISKNKTVYLELWKDNKPQVYRTALVNNNYEKPKKLNYSSSGNAIELQPYVNPDEKYLIFASMENDGFGGFDLYITFQNSDGAWTKPKNMGSKINSSGGEGSSFVSMDGKYLFFSRSSDIFWVDARIINDLKPEGL